MRLHTELKSLFGKQIVKASQRLEATQVNALAVKEAAGAFSLLKGQPLEQVAFARNLNPETAAALCRWIADPQFWIAVGNITTH